MTGSSVASSSSERTPERRNNTGRRSKPRNKPAAHHDYTISNSPPLDSLLLSPEVPNHFQRKQQPRDVRKAYRNPTSAYFIPGISGKARCCEQDSDSVLLDDLLSSGSTLATSMRSISTSTRSIASLNSSRSIDTSTRSIGSTSSKRSSLNHISAPTSPTELASRRRSLDNVSNKSRDEIQASCLDENESSNLDLPRPSMSQEWRSSQSLLKCQLASIRSLLY